MSFQAMWGDLAPVGRDPSNGGYRRFAWTREDARLREWFVGAAQQRSLEVVSDRAGNLWAWTAAADSRPGLVLGSHLDSVPDGGAYDGPLCVVGAFAALDLLRQRGVQLTRPVAIVCFADEEGARFGVACAGSRLLTGALDPDRARRLADADGNTLADAAATAGMDVRHLGRDDEALRRVGTFVELHLEQGRGLADALDGRGAAVGVAESIGPHGRRRLDLPTAMLFVRNPTGVSHSPHEHAEPADCLAGVEALATVVAALA